MADRDVSEEGTTLATVDLDGAGRAAFTTNALFVGSHEITATFAGGAGLDPSSNSLTQVVDTRTTSPGSGTWCNNGAVVMPRDGAATPYPSRIIVDGAGVSTTEVTVQLLDVIHSSSWGVNVMLVSPTGQSLVLMSDAGDDSLVGADLTFSDDATGEIPDDVMTGTYRPTNNDDGFEWPTPAPPGSGASTLATFAGENPNGAWSLYVVEDSFNAGRIHGGWCISISVDGRGPQARPTLSPAPVARGWNDGPVTVSWNWRDAGSGIDPAHCTRRTTFGGEGRRTLSATCQDRAGNQTTARRTVGVDTTAPRIRITAPTARRYVQGTIVRANYACSDRSSGVALCRGPIDRGFKVDTFLPGRHRFTVIAKDRVGNVRRVTVPYTVVVPRTSSIR